MSPELAAETRDVIHEMLSRRSIPIDRRDGRPGDLLVMLQEPRTKFVHTNWFEGKYRRRSGDHLRIHFRCDAFCVCPINTDPFPDLTVTVAVVDSPRSMVEIQGHTANPDAYAPAVGTPRCHRRSPRARVVHQICTREGNPQQKKAASN